MRTRAQHSGPGIPVSAVCPSSQRRTEQAKDFEARPKQTASDVYSTRSQSESRSQSDITTVATPPAEAGGTRTNLGWLDEVKKAGEHSCRVIVNCGTKTFAHYNVLAGSVFGRGRAAKLLSDLAKTKDDPLANRKLVTANEDSLVVTDCCQVATRCTLPIRKPLTYFRVIWKDDQVVNWLTSTDLCKVTGTKYATEHFYNVLTVQWLENQDYFEATKKSKLHPEQQRPLTSEEREAMPWLCSFNTVSRRGKAYLI